MPTKYQTTDKIISNIYQTTNYDQFVLPSYSRPVSKARIKALTKSISEFDFTVPAIEVKPTDHDKLLIIDGQARFVTLKSLKMPIHYFITNDTNYNSTIYLAQRNAVHSWTTLDRISSFANNPHNFSDPKFQQKVQQQYRNLELLIQETHEILGQVPILALVHQIQGINSAIDQQVNAQATDYKLGLFEVKNAKQFILTIRRFNDFMSNIPYIRISSSFFKSMFVILADDHTNIKYFDWLINHQHDQFELITAQHDSRDMLLQLINFYNANIQTWKKRGPKPKPIAATIGRSGNVKMTGAKFHHELFI